MNKDTQKNITYTHNIDVYLPRFKKLKELYSLLISHKGKSFRLELFDELDKVYFPPCGRNAWKLRFIYPERAVPRRNLEGNLKLMEEFTIWMLQKQTDYIREQINLKVDALKDVQEEIESLEKRLSDSLTEIKNYNDTKQETPGTLLQMRNLREEAGLLCEAGKQEAVR